MNQLSLNSIIIYHQPNQVRFNVHSSNFIAIMNS